MPYVSGSITASASASANGFYYYLHTCCSRGIVLNKNSNFHTCISRRCCCCRVRAPPRRRRRGRAASLSAVGYGIGCRISWQSGKTDVATSVCLAQHTHTQTHTLASNTAAPTHSDLALSANSLSRSSCERSLLRYSLRALSASCCAAWPFARSWATVRADDATLLAVAHSSWLWLWLWLWLAGLRQTCLLAKMVCLACLVVAFVAAASAAVGNQKNLAAHSTLDSRMGRQQAGRQAGRLAGWQMRRPCQLTQMVIDSLFPLNTARLLLLHPVEAKR